MSKALSKLRLIEDSDFHKAEDRIEKMQMVLLEPRMEDLLTDLELAYWMKLREAFALVFKEFSQAKAIRIIRRHMAGCDRYETARRLYDDMAAVYGPFMTRNKQLARAQLIERLWAIGVRLERDGKLTEAADIFEKAGKFEGLDKHDQLELDPADIELPEITITNDPQFINADYEDVTDENPDEPEEESLF